MIAATKDKEQLVSEISGHARFLFHSRRYLCTEAVLIALNQGFNGSLTKNQTVALAAPFGEALGESGCLCGALSGAVMACGLLLGGEHPHRRRRSMRACAKQLHDAFREANGATCCRVLSREVKGDRDAHFEQCRELTAYGARLAADLILRQRPKLARSSAECIRLKKPVLIRDVFGVITDIFSFLTKRRRS
jgi:C_GCAxxG_C_C family probable redox protein